jgi:hypothetical protein
MHHKIIVALWSASEEPQQNRAVASCALHHHGVIAAAIGRAARQLRAIAESPPTEAEAGVAARRTQARAGFRSALAVWTAISDAFASRPA